MCGIIGFFTRSRTDEQQLLLHRLVKESQVRGLHAFGVACYRRQRTIETRKWRALPGDKELPGANKLIYHNRYSTSGDWHCENNNQPITVGDVSVAVNGVLSMKPRSEYEAEYGIKCETDNDAEIFAQRLLADDDPERLVESLAGSIAAVFLRDGKVFAIRNNARPLHWFKRLGAVYVASTVDIIDRAVGKRVAVHNVPPYKLFDLSRHV